jgi:hypothetical protein
MKRQFFSTLNYVQDILIKFSIPVVFLWENILTYKQFRNLKYNVYNLKRSHCCTPLPIYL